MSPEALSPLNADDALERLSFLGRAGELLTSSLDYETTLTRVAELVVPGLAAWCTIDMVGENGELRGLAVAHADPAKVAWARELADRNPPDPQASHGAAKVVRTGEPELVPEITDELLVAATGDDPEFLRMLRELGLSSSICVPLVARGRVLGAITLIADQPGRRYDERDLELALELARRAATAVDNARLYTHLERSEERYRLLFDRNPLPMWVYDTEVLTFLDVNDAAVRRYGYPRDAFLSMTIAEIQADGDPPLGPGFEEASAAPRITSARHRTKEGALIDVEVTTAPVVFANRDAALVLAHDVTERKRLEQHLAQSQKMEAVGRLAGGVAHDFNNLLLVITGYTEMLLARPDAAELRGLDEIARAADQAAALTRQLLAFSRKQVLQPRVINLSDVIAGLEPMLRRVIGEDIEIAVRLAPDLAEVEADTGELERVILNLAINARDAMPSGGRLSIEASNVELDEKFATTHLEGASGPNVLLSVSDTGMGLSAEARSHLFEPFFTTKESGIGTGLGLATVFGIVKQSSGSIYVYSEPGQGTAFKIYLPAAAVPYAAQPTSKVGPQARRGNETILLVEDERQVRELVQTMLETNGYRVLVADGSDDAVSMCAKEAGNIDLLLTDVVMPRISGPELAEKLRHQCPTIRVLFMSGYSDEAVQRRGILSPDSFFIEKPFSGNALSQKVRDALAR